MADNEAWAVVELMGHVKVAGRISEEEKFGINIGRIDVPTCEKCGCPNPAIPTVECCRCYGAGFVRGFVTQYFGGSSVYRITLVSEEVARIVAKSNSVQPVSSWDFPKAIAGASVSKDRFDHDNDEVDIDPDQDDSQF